MTFGNEVAPEYLHRYFIPALKVNKVNVSIIDFKGFQDCDKKSCK